MTILVGMPYSVIYLTQQDSQKSISKIREYLTFKAKVYNPVTRKREDYPVCLLEQNSDGTYQFRTGLLYRVQKIAQVHGLTLELDDRRVVPQQNPELMGVDLALRDYQETSVQKLLKHDMGLLYAATGSGKTHMAAAIIRRRALSTLFLVHTRDLMYQAKDRISELLHTNVGIVGDSQFDPRTVTVATFQTLNRLYDEKGKLPRFDMIVIDEVHHLPAETFYKVSSGFSCRYVYGLSATPDRADGTDMMIEAGVGAIADEINPSVLIRAGVLVRPEINMIPVKARSNFRRMPPNVVTKYFMEDHEVRNKMIAEITKERIAAGKSVLVAVRHVKHAATLHKLLPEAEMMLGEDSSEERKRILDGFRAKKIRLVISTLLSEGVDIPTLDVVVNAAGGRDMRQLVGRALRKAEGKDKAEIYDFIDNQHVTLLANSKARMKALEAEEEFRVIVHQ